MVEATSNNVSFSLACTPEDLRQVASIYNHYVGKTSMDVSPVDWKNYQEWMTQKSDREELWLGRTADTQKAVGWGIVKQYSPREGYRRTAETSIYIHPDYIRRGVGSALKKHLIARARVHDYAHLVAKIWAENHASIAYNQKLGYTIVGTQRKIGYVNGRWIDIVLMQLLL